MRIWDFLISKSKNKNSKSGYQEVQISELCQSTIEYRARELAFLSCVNLIANAIGRCVMRTYRDGAEIKEREYYMWNVSPSTNQSAPIFWHKLITKLFSDGEALVIFTRRRDGYDAAVVADSYMVPEHFPDKQDEYKGVVVGDMQYDKTFRENEVLHFRLNHVDVKPLLNGMYESFCGMLNAAIKQNTWSSGQHWKVHVDQIAGGGDEFEQKFMAMIQEQIKPFFDSNGAVLPEFDGYSYEQVSGGGSSGNTRDIRALVDDIYAFTARALCVPSVLTTGDIADAADANSRFLTYCIDPICDQITAEINRKRYGYEEWKKGNYARFDSSSISHFDMFTSAGALEKLIGTGAFTINEVRRVAGQPEINEDWANRTYMTKNIGSIASEGGETNAQENVGNQVIGG